jgi:flagellar biosynthesis protein FlhB
VTDRAAGTRTEEPTPRRLAEARRQGQVGVSRELSAAVALAAVFIVLLVGGAAGVGRLAVYLRSAFGAAPRGGSASVALGAGLAEGASLLALPLFMAVVAVVVSGLAQTGGLFSLAPLRLDAGRAAPSLRRVISGDALVAAAHGLTRAFILVGLAALALEPLVRPLAGLAGAPAGQVLASAGRVAAALGWRLATAGIMFGVVDLLWQRHRHRRRLRMTRWEVERERRQHEGDPRHKAERQRRHRSLLAQPGLSAVRQGDFVLVAPRRAVVLRYDGVSAPVVVARGERLVAARLVERARLLGLPSFPGEALVEALEEIGEGQPIPEAVYEPVATIVQVIVEERRAR